MTALVVEQAQCSLEGFPQRPIKPNKTRPSYMVRGFPERGMEFHFLPGRNKATFSPFYCFRGSLAEIMPVFPHEMPKSLRFAFNMKCTHGIAQKEV